MTMVKSAARSGSEECRAAFGVTRHDDISIMSRGGDDNDLEAAVQSGDDAPDMDRAAMDGADQTTSHDALSNDQTRIASKEPADSANDSAAPAGLLYGLQQMGQAAAVLDKSGLVIAMNALAEQHMGHAIFLREGRLAASTRDADTRLQALIKSLIDPSERSDPDPLTFVVLPGVGGHSLVLQGTPIGGDGLGLFLRANGILTFTDIHKATLPRAAVLRDMFGLTSSEASIALAIANGDDPRAIAAQRGISVDTVRTHLKAIFGKTNTRRQVSLAVLVARVQGVLKTT